MARQSAGDSYYTIIRGKKYDRRMLELAEGLTSGRGDGRISINDAKNLLRVVKDANNYSPTEKATMEYIRRHFKFTKEGDEYFRNEIRKWAASKGKKKATAKSKKAGADEAAPAAAMAVGTAVSSASAAMPTTSGGESKPQGSALKTILIALILLAAIAAAFYFFVYKSGCAPSRPAANEVVPVTSQPPTPAPAAPAATSTPPASAPAPVAAKPATPEPKGEVAADVKAYVEKARVLFVAEKTVLSPTSEKALDELAAKLKGSSAKLQITGHTCSLGPKELNQKISEKRANVVKDALVARGVSAAQIETRGVGDTQPVGDNKTVAGRVANRRVVFKLLN